MQRLPIITMKMLENIKPAIKKHNATRNRNGIDAILLLPTFVRNHL